MRAQWLVLLAALATSGSVAAKNAVAMPWTPPDPSSPELLSFLRNTSRPKLAYSTWVGWYMDGGLNETSLWAQVEAMADTLRPHGFTHVLHDYGWQVCGTTYAIKEGCIHVDSNGRLFPSPERYPSTAVGGDPKRGSWKAFVDRAHAKGIAYGVHLMHGIPKIAVDNKLPILNSPYTADEIVATPRCQTFIPDHWSINASHPGAQLYYDSVVAMWAADGIDFVYLDGVVADCGYCHIQSAAMFADSLRRLGNGMHLFISAGPPSMECGAPFDALSAVAPYVRVGSDTVDSWDGSVENGFSMYTRLTAPSVGPNHFGDLASLMVGKVHCNHAAKNRTCGPGPDYFIPSPESTMTEPEVYSYAAMVAIFRSTWWPSGVLSEMNDFQVAMLTNDDVIRVTMATTRNRQAIDAHSKSYAGPGVVWTADDELEPTWKYVLLVNLGPAGGTPAEVAVNFDQLGLTARTTCDVTELWKGAAMPPASGALSAVLAPHASLFVKLSGCA